MILRIARLELSKLFGSPVAWIVLALFAGITGLNIMTHLAEMHTMMKTNASPPSLTGLLLFFRSEGINTMHTYLMFLLPLLTMGLISQEASSGTIKLLYSSPIKIHSLVLGKFLAIVAFSGLLLAFCVLTIFVLISAIGQPDYGLVAAGILSTVCLTMSYCAVGLFMSSLTTYPVVAAIATVALLFFLQYLGGISIGIAWIDELTYGLSIADHLTETKSGLINSKDLVYYLLVVVLFIVLTIVNLKAQRLQGVERYKMRGLMALAVMVAAGLGYISSKPALNKTSDWTATQQHTIHPITQGYFSALDGDLTIVDFVHVLTSFRLAPSARLEEMKSLDRFIRFMPSLQREHIFFNDEDTERTTRLNYRQDLSHAEKAAIIADLYDMPDGHIISRDELYQRYPILRTVNQTHFNQGRLIASQGHYGLLADGFSDQYFAGQPSEAEYAAALKRLKQPAVKVGVLTGHHSADWDTYKSTDWGSFWTGKRFRYALINNGFSVSPVTLTADSLADDVEILIIADPKTAFSAEEMAYLDAYLAQGGDLLLAFETPHHAAVQPLLQRLGLAASDQPIAGGEPFLSVLTDAGHQALDSHVVSPVMVNGASMLSITARSDFQITPVMQSDTANQSSMMLLERPVNGAQQRIVVTGDASLFSNQLLYSVGSGPTPEVLLIKDLMAWLSDGQYPIRIPKVIAQDTQWVLSNSRLTLYRYLMMLLLPLIPIAVGVVVWRTKSRR